MVVAVSPYKAKQSATSRDAIASSPVTTGANFYHTKAQSAALDVAGGAILPEAGTKQLALPQKAVAAPLVAVPAALGVARFASAQKVAETPDSHWEAANSCLGGRRQTESHSSRSTGKSHRAAAGSRVDSHTRSSRQAATDPYRGCRRNRRAVGPLQVPGRSACQ